MTKNRVLCSKRGSLFAVVAGSIGILAPLSTGCSSDELEGTQNPANPDASITDAISTDTRVADASVSDVSSSDANQNDGNTGDGAASDARLGDGGLSDSTPGDAASDAGAYEGARRYIQEVVAKEKGASASVALLDGDKIVWTETFGALDAKGNAATADTMYPIASSSKMLVTTAIMKLVDADKISLDEPITKYLPTFKMASPEYKYITVRMLLNHSTGFPGTDENNVHTVSFNSSYAQQVLDTLAISRLKHAPGYMNVYCNDCFTVAEKVVEAVANKTYADYLKQEILDPLGMTHSLAPINNLPANSYYAQTVAEGLGATAEINNCLGAGGLYSTPTDLLKFAKVFLGSADAKLLSTAAINAMAKDETEGKFKVVDADFFRYGLGWDSVKEYGLSAIGRKGWVKGGSVLTYNSVIMIAPDDKMAVSVTTANLSGSYHSLAQRVMFEGLMKKGVISSIPAPNTLANAPAGTAPSDVLQSIAGYFGGSSEFHKIEVKTDNSFNLFSLKADGWTSTGTSYKFRSNNWFEADGDTSIALATKSAGNRQYLLYRSPSGFLNTPMELPMAQKLTSPGTMTTAWQKRVGKSWVIVNEIPDSVNWYDGNARYISPIAVPGFDGIITGKPGGTLTFILDASADDRQARTMIMIPTVWGRDICDLDVEDRQGEDWMRYCHYRFRPVETMPDLAPSASTTVTVPATDNAVWYRIPAALAGTKITVSGPAKGKWMTCDKDFKGILSNITGTTWPAKIDASAQYLVVIGEGQNSFSLTTAP